MALTVNTLTKPQLRLGRVLMILAVYDDSMSAISGAMSSPRTSPFASSADYNVQEFGPSYMSMLDGREPWTPNMAVSVPSTVSSPSSCGNPDEYGAYIPTSVPASMIDGMSSTAATRLNGKDVKMEYDDVDSGERPFPCHLSRPTSASRNTNHI
jgi:hypothetical protein